MPNDSLRDAALLLFAGFAGAACAQTPGPNNAITDVPGISVGHATGSDSGVTVVLVRGPTGQGIPAGMVTRGGSPVTRETDVLNPVNRNESVNAILLAGGSLHGLAATGGVMLCLEGRGIGVGVGGGVVPIVPTAASFDRATCGGPPSTRPDLAAGQQACAAAATGAVPQGNVGAGTGAVAGGVKGGIGSASVVLSNGIVVGALVSVNSEGAPYDSGGDLHARPLALGNEALALSRARADRVPLPPPGGPLRSGTNAVVATNVQLTKAQATQIAQMADDGIARAIQPAHTPGDGDTLFALGTARIPMGWLGDEAEVMTQIGAAAANTVARAIGHALVAAKSTACQRSYCDTFPAACRGPNHR
jgi:L-aminopeptidase/D-esterase-like protein